MKDITGILVETTLRKTIKDIKDSPKRSIRNLVDLGLNFSSGRFLKPFLEAIHKMLENENSPYYDLVSDLVHNVDNERLISFGMNVGYNGCTKGAKKIREIESRENYNIPWSLSLVIDGKRYSENEEHYLNVIKQGVETGIYNYMLFLDGAVKPVLSLAEKYPDCAFDLFCPNGYIDSDFLDEVQRLNNVMIVAEYDENLAERIYDMRERQLLYSVYIPYSQHNLQKLTDDDFYAEIDDLHPVFTALVPEKECTEQTIKQMYAYLCEKRKKQAFATILFDVLSDVKRIDSIISDDECLASFDKNGSLISENNTHGNDSCNVFKMSLADILMVCCPKK